MGSLRIYTNTIDKYWYCYRAYSPERLLQLILRQQVDPLRDATSSSSASTTPHPELDQLRIAVRHPLPPAGTIKHDAVDEDISKWEHVYNYNYYHQWFQFPCHVERSKYCSFLKPSR